MASCRIGHVNSAANTSKSTGLYLHNKCPVTPSLTATDCLARSRPNHRSHRRTRASRSPRPPRANCRLR
eukprot:11946641-Alexandrium_andersonii.AAC.1